MSISYIILSSVMHFKLWDLKYLQSFQLSHIPNSGPNNVNITTHFHRIYCVLIKDYVFIDA